MGEIEAVQAEIAACESLEKKTSRNKKKISINSKADFLINFKVVDYIVTCSKVWSLSFAIGKS